MIPYSDYDVKLFQVLSYGNWMSKQIVDKTVAKIPWASFGTQFAILVRIKIRKDFDFYALCQVQMQICS